MSVQQNKALRSVKFASCHHGVKQKGKLYNLGCGKNSQ